LDIDSDFYNKFNPIYDSLSKIVPLYNSVRNYITKKPFNTGKYKLNFNCSTLGKGWDQNKIDNQNYTLIFKEKKDYYLGILNVKKDKTILNAKKNKDIYLKDSDLKIMILKTLGDIKKQLPRIAFSKRYKDFPDITIIENYYEEYKKYKKPKNKKEFDKDKAFKLIDYFKYILKNHPENYLKIYNIKLKDNNEFMTLEEFLDDITKQFYKLSLESINKDYILSQVEKGNLYLFKIHNKDFSEFSKGKKNLHTLYFESLFSDENLKDVVYKLSGNAELFYRKGSPNNPVIHPKNQKIKNKNPINNKTESLFTYDIIKDKRYKEDKFFFHCPIELNYKSSNKSNVNSFIYSIISKSENINILGIDRGERNLIYYSLINLKGEILKQGSLNIIVDEKGRQINYLEKLDQLEKERQEAKKNWKAITKIKELKEGYLSYIIHQLSKMIIENNAIVILEDLNSGFKTGRIKIEKQIYQKFERKLIEKLNYLVFKDINSKEAGGLLKAYQLTNKFESFKKLGRQSGILFYVNARNTSKIDPTTGFINKLWPNFINISKAKEFFSTFDEIYYNKDENYFVFKFKYINFKNIKIDDNKSEFYNKVWEVCTYGTRWTTKLIKNTNKYEYVEVNLTQELKRLFDKYSINYDSSYNIKEQILIHNEADFFKSLIHYLKLTLQLRNLNETEDYILSCVKNKNNEFFDSRKAKENEPKDGDANGAYNIAVKGLIIVDKIKNAEKSEKFDLKIEEPEYLDFVFKKNK
ncbi:MAG: type V CRISPR-associated protein Cas12a/Cpf1, partial [Candidatus Woesearchaeota archaeon]